MKIRVEAIRGFGTEYGLLLALIILLVLAVTGIINSTYDWAAYPLQQQNDEFLTRSLTDTVQLMVPIGIAKGAADLIEGSTITIEGGVVLANAGTEIEAGDTIQPLLDYLDVAWRILLISLIYLTAAKSLLPAMGPVAQALLVIALLSYVALFLFKRYVGPDQACTRATRRLAGMCLLATLFFALLLPLTVNISARLSKATTDPLREGMWRSFNKVGKVFSVEHIQRAESIKEKARLLQEKSREIAIFSMSATVDVAASVAKLAVIKILNGIVFPLGSLLFLIWLVRGTLYPALGLSEEPLSRQDLIRLREFVTKQEPKGRKPQGDRAGRQ
jgi:hypothetical protein